MVAIIGLLVSLLLPAVNASREAARRASCLNNLRQIGIGVLAYESAKGHLPPGQSRRSKKGDDIYAWSYEILPFIEETSIWNRIDTRYPMTSRLNKGTASAPGPVTEVISLYLCPSTGRTHASRTGGRIQNVVGHEPWDTEKVVRDDDDRPMGNLGAIDYLASSGPNQFAQDKLGNRFGRNRGVFLTFKGSSDQSTTYPIPRIRSDKILDGSSKTLMVTECTGQGWFIDSTGDGHGAWANGQNIGTVGGAEDPNNAGQLLHVPPINMPELLAWGNEEPRSDHPGGVHALMCDGSTCFWPDDVPLDVLLAFATRDGDEVVDQQALK